MHRLLPSIDSKTSPAPPNANESLTIAIQSFRQDPKDKVAVNDLIRMLEDTSKELARSSSLRASMGLTPILWDDLGYLWEHASNQELEIDSVSLIGGLGKLTRNLVAEVPPNQQRAFQFEPSIRRIIHRSTAMSMIHIPQMNAIARILTQALSNIITANDSLADQLWNSYMQFADEENILIRLAAVDDVNTLSTVFVFMLNLLKSNEMRCQTLCNTESGRRTSIALLDHISVLIESPEDSPESKACDIAYQVFKQLFDFGLGLSLYTKLKFADQPITPHQRTLLKLLDGYYQINSSNTHSNYAQQLPVVLLDLSSFAISAIQTALAADELNPDRHLPPVCEALVLVTQCIHVTLVRESESKQSIAMRAAMKDAKTKEGIGAIEICIELLRQLDLFVPKIVFGKPIKSPLSGSQTKREQANDSKGFNYIKRDVIKVIAALSHKDRDVQDRVRGSGGIEVVLNHCVMDERNPYLREHAIFAIRNLLEDNLQNQENVSQLKPLKDFDVDGILRTLSPRERQ